MREERKQQDNGHEALAEALRTSFRLLRAIMVLLLVLYLFSGVFVVRQHEKAFVLLFGRIHGAGSERMLEPGIHWTFPQPVAEVVRIPAERVQAIETDTFWYYVSEQDRISGKESPPGSRLDPRKDGYALSGDANVLHSRWVLRYTIEQPELYAFRFANAEDVLRRELDHAVVKTSARFLIDQALRTNIEAFRTAVDSEVRQRCDLLNLGVEVQRIDVLALVPPRQVAKAFDAVVEAEQERSRQISTAKAYTARLLNEAEGEASRTISEGETYRKRLVSQVSADADYFEAVYEKYAENPRITAQTLLQDTLRRVLTRVEEKYIVYESESGAQQIWLQLGPEAKDRKK